MSSMQVLRMSSTNMTETKVLEVPAIQNDVSEETVLSNATSSSPSPSTPSFRDCLAFALPALGIYACPPLMSLIDASFIGRLASSVELAALGPASSISDSAPLPLLFLSIGSTNLIARAVARNDTAKLAIVSRTALTMGGVLGVLLALALYTFSSPLSTMYCGEAAGVLAAPCHAYVSIRALALPFVVLATIAQAISIGTKDSRTPMISVVIAGALNLLGDLVLVKFLGKGIAGAAAATAVSQVLAAGLLLRVLQKRGFLEKPERKPQLMTDGTRSSSSSSHPASLQTAKQLFSFVPFLFIMLIKMFWHNACASTAASLGGSKAAAHTALLSVAMLCFILGDVGSSLAQAFLPAFVRSSSDEEVKDGDASSPETDFDLPAALPTIRQLLKCTLSISTAAMIIASTAIGIFGHQITSDPAVLQEMKQALPWVITALSVHGSVVTLEGLLLVRKKFRILSVFYTILGGTVAAFQIATKRFDWGLAGVWGCYVWFCGSRFVTFSALGGLMQPVWQRIRRLAQPPFTNINQQVPFASKPKGLIGDTV
eukprot:scaffold3806_cov169-Amphora_coffeaeformis.AAC.18